MATQVFSDITPNGAPYYFLNNGVYYMALNGKKSGDANNKFYVYKSTDRVNWTDMNFPNPDTSKTQQFGSMEFDNSGNPFVIFFGQQSTTVTNVWWSRWTGSAWTSVARVNVSSYNQSNAQIIKAGNSFCISYVQADSGSNTASYMRFVSAVDFTWSTTVATIASMSANLTSAEYIVFSYYDGVYYHSVSLGYDASYNFQVYHRKTSNPTTTWPARTQVTSGAYSWNNVALCKYGSSGLMLVVNRTDANYSNKYVYYYWIYNGSSWTSKGTLNPEAYNTSAIFGLINFSDTDIRCIGYGNSSAYPSTLVLKLSKWNGTSWNGWEIKDDGLTAYNRFGRVGGVIKQSTYFDYAFQYASTPATFYISTTRTGVIDSRSINVYLNSANLGHTKIAESNKNLNVFAQSVKESLTKILDKSVSIDSYMSMSNLNLEKFAGTEANVYSESTNCNINKAINSNKNINTYMSKAFVLASINVITDNVKTVTTYMSVPSVKANPLIEVTSDTYMDGAKVSSNRTVIADKLANVYMSNVLNYVDKMNVKHAESNVFSEIANISINSYKIAELVINSYMGAVRQYVERSQVASRDVDSFMKDVAVEMEAQRLFGRIVDAYANKTDVSIDIQIPGLNTNISTSSTGNTASITLHPDNNNVILNVGQSKLIVDDKVNNANISTSSNKIIISVKEEN